MKGVYSATHMTFCSGVSWSLPTVWTICPTSHFCCNHVGSTCRTAAGMRIGEVGGVSCFRGQFPFKMGRRFYSQGHAAALTDYCMKHESYGLGYLKAFIWTHVRPVRGHQQITAPFTAFQRQVLPVYKMTCSYWTWLASQKPDCGRRYEAGTAGRGVWNPCTPEKGLPESWTSPVRHTKRTQTSSKICFASWEGGTWHIWAYFFQ